MKSRGNPVPVKCSSSQSPSARWFSQSHCAAQRSDGDWDEDHFTGTGFPRDFMIRYHLYRIVWPLIALGRYRAARD